MNKQYSMVRFLIRGSTELIKYPIIQLKLTQWLKPGFLGSSEADPHSNSPGSFNQTSVIIIAHPTTKGGRVDHRNHDSLTAQRQINLKEDKQEMIMKTYEEFKTIICVFESYRLYELNVFHFCYVVQSVYMTSIVVCPSRGSDPSLPFSLEVSLFFFFFLFSTSKGFSFVKGLFPVPIWGFQWIEYVSKPARKAAPQPLG